MFRTNNNVKSHLFWRNMITSLLAIFVALLLLRAFSGDTFFIPVPSPFAPTAEFGCPEPGTIFTYDVPAWNTSLPNKMLVIEETKFSCRIRSDAQGVYDWFGGLRPHLEDGNVKERKLVIQLWPLRVGRSAEWTNNNQKEEWDSIRFIVKDYRLSRVPAGLFWAYKIEKTYSRGYRDYLTTLWWSPGLKWTIRQWPEEAGTPSIVGGYNWDLLDIKRPTKPQQAPK
jgi:hypothetical protein